MTLKETIWQSDAMSALRRIADEDRLPHALLISGPSGAGKLLMAEMLAQYIHCANPQDGHACGRCDSCLQHASFNHADLHYVFPITKRDKLDLSSDFLAEWREFRRSSPFAEYTDWLSLANDGKKSTTIYASEANDIIRKLNMSNLAARYKIMIVWLPEKMQEAAANKLLKIIEEPFADTKMIFVSEQPSLILPTILSRLQQYVLPRMDSNSLARALTTERGLDEETACEVARLSECDINRAYSIIDSQAETNEFRGYFQTLMRDAYSRNVKGMLAWSEKFGGENREKILRFLAYTAGTLRENYIYNLKHPELNVISKEDEKFSVNFARFITDDNITKLSDETDSAVRDIAGNANARIVLFDYCIQLLIHIRKN